ncbi:MAG: AI-2E family transporter [Bauldia sp.]|nr:AI-2E family transporter [Bauldia sp.]
MSIDRRILFWFAALGLFLLFMFVFSPILLPFVVGMAIAYMLDPVADWFERRGLSRLMATMMILILFVVAFVAFLILVVPILVNQLATLLDDIPRYVKRIEELIESVLTSSWAENLGVNPDTVRSSISDYLNQGARWFTTVIPSIWSGSLAFINVLALAVVAPVVAFFLLYDWDRMIDKVDSWLPRDSVEEVRRLGREIDGVIADFVRGQALVGLTLGTFYASGLVIIGVNFGFLIGLVAGIISFIPYVGSTLGFIASVGIALVQFWPDWIWIAVTATLFVVGQLLEGYVLQPYFIGGNVGLHPVWLMFALFAFGFLFGFVGLLVAIPAAAAIGVLVRYGLSRYLDSPFYRGEAKAKRK